MSHAIISAPKDYSDEPIAGRSAKRSLRLTPLGAKRGFDVAFALGLLVGLSPLMLSVAAAVFLTSPGPVFYRQRRVGLCGEEFVMIKFRTMRHAACTLQPIVNEGVLLKPPADSRLTPVGRFLRRFSLDELPQFWNVLCGDMSLVGPRPLPRSMLTGRADFLRSRSAVQPGLTGLWQIRDRHLNTSIAYMLPHDLEYVRTRSLYGDCKIALRTVAIIFRGHGAM